jgi:hypothetical protein
VREPVLHRQEGREVAGVAPANGPVRGVEHEVEQGGHLALAQLVPDQAVELLEHALRRVPLERVSPQRASQLSHHRGGGQALAGHVAHHEAHPSARDRDHVVPVAPHLGLRRGGQIPRCHSQTRQLRETLRQQAALERLSDPVLALVHACLVDAERDAIGRQPQQPQVLGAEAPRLAGPHQQHAGDVRVGHHRDPDHGIGLLEEQRLAALRYALREFVGRGQPVVVRKPVRTRPRGELDRAVLLPEVDQRRVRAQHPAHSGDQVVDDVAERAVCERCVHQELHPADHLGDPLGLRAGGLLA